MTLALSRESRDETWLPLLLGSHVLHRSTCLDLAVLFRRAIEPGEELDGANR